MTTNWIFFLSFLFSSKLMCLDYVVYISYFFSYKIWIFLSFNVDSFRCKGHPGLGGKFFQDRWPDWWSSGDREEEKTSHLRGASCVSCWLPGYSCFRRGADVSLSWWVRMHWRQDMQSRQSILGLLTGLMLYRFVFPIGWEGLKRLGVLSLNAIFFTCFCFM